MTATSPDRYELYRVVTDMDALQEAFRDRVEDLDVTRESLDEAGGFTVRHSAKLLASNPGRSFGNVSLPKMLKATGMVLVLVIDDERFAEVKEVLVKRRRPPVVRQPAIAGSAPPAWLFVKGKAREMGKRRFSLMTEAQRKRHQRKAGKASGKARRRKATERERVTV